VRLTVETGPLAGTIVALDRDHPTTIGSAGDCKLRIQEAGVLPQQAVVKALKDQGFGLKALGAGVRVNGAAVEATPLRDGDIVEIGTTRIAFGQVQKRGLPTIAGYRILGELGKGGMGTVYRAEQTSLNRDVALKVLSRERTKDPAFVAKFVAEARAAAKLQHPNVVQVFDVDNDGETYFISMEVMHDGSLESWLKRHGTMPVDRALAVVADAARGLAYAESLDIVHRDIKPDNLMLDQHGAVKIADLGLASTVEETEDKAIGTPHFMAPEQVLKKELDHRTDLYALGCTFYRLVTGKTPFRGQTVKDILRAQVKDDAEPANKANPEVPGEIAAIIAKLMAKEPAQRYQTANALLEEIEVLQQPPAKKGLWIGLAAAAALVAGGAIYWAVTRDPQVIKVREKYDDPEKQRFADELDVLRGQQKQDRATIALLQTRVSGLTGNELARALERVAAEHPNTEAAATGNELAAQLRSRTEQDERTAAARTQQRNDHLAALRQAIAAPQQARNYAAAAKALELAPPTELADDAELQVAVAALREQTTSDARAWLQSLQTNIATARSGKDEAALQQANAAFAAALVDRTRWPAAMANELDQAARELAAAEGALRDLATARGEAAWQQYAAIFASDGGLRQALARLDFPAAAAAATAFATAAGDTSQATRARGLAQALQHAEVAAKAIESAAPSGHLHLPGDDGQPLTVLRWDRAGQAFVLAEPNKKPVKEIAMAAAKLSPEAWQALGDGLEHCPPGSRECLLGFIAVYQHQLAASKFLGRLTAADDQSGTGSNAYPLRASLFDLLLRRLPETDAEPWAATLRDELRAGQRLAAGLRAMSERRNLAAATHLERLLADHPHSFVVATLP
jgi:tRNA A-37 threonylcarbamoyl transferase component Bud32